MQKQKTRKNKKKSRVFEKMNNERQSGGRCGLSFVFVDGVRTVKKMRLIMQMAKRTLEFVMQKWVKGIRWAKEWRWNAERVENREEEEKEEEEGL